MTPNCFYSYLTTFLIGVLWGGIELYLRYEVFRPLFATYKKNDISGCQSTRGKTFWYLFLNGAFSVAALLFIYEFSDNHSSAKIIDWRNVIIAGTSSMVLLRTSLLYKSSIDNSRCLPILERLLSVLDKKIDNNIQAEKICAVDRIMQKLQKYDFDKVKQNLPLLCTSYLRNMNAEKSKWLAFNIATINGDLENHVKLKMLANFILEYCNTNLLQECVESYIRNNNQSKEDSEWNELKDELNKL